MSVEPNFVKIGQNIKIMRIRKGVTQSELAKKLGISQTHMSNLEHGRVSVNKKNTCIQLPKCLKKVPIVLQ